MTNLGNLARLVLVSGGFLLLQARPATAGPTEQGSKTFIVLDLAAPPVLRNLGRVVSMTITKEAGKDGAEAMDSRTLGKKVGKAKAESASACGVDPECLSIHLADLGFSRVIAGTFSKTKTHYQMRLVNVDIASRQIVSHLDKDILIASRALTKEIKAGIPELLKGEPAKMGTLVIHSEVSGATVEVDGKQRGHTPSLKLSLAPGKHRVIVRRENYLPLDRYVDVSGEEDTAFEAKLFLIPGREAPSIVAAAVAPVEKETPKRVLRVPLATWIAGGASLLAAGVGVTYGLRSESIGNEAVDEAPQNGILDLTRVRALKGKSAATLSNVFYGVAGAGAVTAVVVAALLGSTEEVAPAAEPATASAQLQVAPLADGAYVGLKGSF